MKLNLLLFALGISLSTYAQTSSTNYPTSTTLVTTNATGNNAWRSYSSSGLVNGLTGVTDNNDSTVSFANLGSTSIVTNRFAVHNYAFNIPSSATINGIEVEVIRMGSAAKIKDSVIALTFNASSGSTASIAGVNKRNVSDFWTGTNTWTVSPSNGNILNPDNLEHKIYGGSTDLWGNTSITPAQVNNLDFGILIQCYTPVTSSASSAYITAIKVKIYYSLVISDLVVSTLNNVPSEINTNAGTLQLKAEVLPIGVDTNVTWSIVPTSGNASIDNNGLVTAIANGSVWAKATSTADTTVTDSLQITITNQIIPVSGLQVTTAGGINPVIDGLNETLQLEAIVMPAGTDQSVLWNIIPITGDAMISGTGLVTATATGSVWAKAVSVQDSNFVDSIAIQITNSTGLDQVKNSVEIKAFPVPFAEKLSMNFDNMNGQPLHVRLVNITGYEVYSYNLPAATSNLEINTADLQAGIYILCIEDTTGKKYKTKLLKH